MKFIFNREKKMMRAVDRKLAALLFAGFICLTYQITSIAADQADPSKGCPASEHSCGGSGNTMGGGPGGGGTGPFHPTDPLTPDPTVKPPAADCIHHPELSPKDCTLDCRAHPEYCLPTRPQSPGNTGPITSGGDPGTRPPPVCRFGTVAQQKACLKLHKDL
jgi:hypothetical protein